MVRAGDAILAPYEWHVYQNYVYRGESDEEYPTADFRECAAGCNAERACAGWAFDEDTGLCKLMVCVYPNEEYGQLGVYSGIKSTGVDLCEA